MVKKFTLDDVVDIPVKAHMTGVLGCVWCKILFKGCAEPVEFYAAENGPNDFSKEVYQAVFIDGKYGELQHGMGGFMTQPKDQEEVEASIRAQRDELLLRSDYVEFPSTQSTLTDAQKTAWSDYRTALRNITEQDTFPWEIQWPTKP